MDETEKLVVLRTARCFLYAGAVYLAAAFQPYHLPITPIYLACLVLLLTAGSRTVWLAEVVIAILVIMTVVPRDFITVVAALR